MSKFDRYSPEAISAIKQAVEEHGLADIWSAYIERGKSKKKSKAVYSNWAELRVKEPNYRHQRKTGDAKQIGVNDGRQFDFFELGLGDKARTSI